MAIRSAALRDALVLVAVFGVLLGGLYLYTGIWPPAVIVESGSMMHPDSEVRYGRSWITFGPATIDPGDLVLVKDVDSVDDVETFVEGGTERYGKPGDVIVYYPANRRAATPIIHRAMAYVEVESVGASTFYKVRWDPDAPCVGGANKQDSWCVYDSDGIDIPSIPVRSYKPTKAGFITKGDNPASNAQIDQESGLSFDERGERSPVQLHWIEGKGRAELPWLGLIKLSLAGRYNQADCDRAAPRFHFFDASPEPKCRGWVAFGYAYAPKDLWVMLGVALFLLVGVPLIYDIYKGIRRRRLEAQGVGDEPPP